MRRSITNKYEEDQKLAQTHSPQDSRVLTKFHSKYPHISLSIWFISFNSNIFCATIHQLWFEYVSSQTILLAIMNAEMNSRCPEEPLADG